MKPTKNAISKILISFLLIISQSGTIACVAAGVLPYTWHGNKMWLLFGQEAIWIRQLRWQDFGGSTKLGQPINEAAAREFSEETRAIWGNSYAMLKNAGFDVDSLNSKVNESSFDYIERYVSQSQQPLIQKLVSQAIKNSVNYILPKLNQDFYVYRQGYNYHQFFAEVDYVSTNTIRRAPKFYEYDKVDYAWVPLQEFMKILDQAKKTKNPDLAVVIPAQYTSGKYNEFRVDNKIANTLLDPRGQNILKKISDIESERIAAQKSAEPPVIKKIESKQGKIQQPDVNLFEALKNLTVSLTVLKNQLLAQ